MSQPPPAHTETTGGLVAGDPSVPSTAPLIPAPVAGTPWDATYRLMTLGLLITIIGAAFEALAVATILPATADDLGGLSLYGWAFSAYMLTNLVGIAVAGGEADLNGPAKPFTLGTALFVGGLIIGGLAPSMLVLILGRAVQGLGAGFVGSVIYVAVGRGYPPEAKPRMLALMSSAWVIPGLIGPAIAGLIADFIGWRWVFLGLVPFPIFAAFMVLPSLRGVPSGDLLARDFRRLLLAVQLAAGAGLFLAGPTLSRPAIAVALVAIGILVAGAALMRLLPQGTLRAAAGLPAAIAVMALVNFGFFGVDAYIPLGLTEVRGRSVAFAGLALTAGTITWSIGTWIQARYVMRVDRRVLVRIGLVLIIAGSLGSLAVLWPSISVFAGPIIWGLAGLGMGMAFATLSLIVLETAAKGQEGAATAAMQLGIVLAMAIATGIGGVLVDAFGEEGSALRTSLTIQYALMVSVLAGTIAVAARLPARPPANASPESQQQDPIAA
jgi:MFS family permease